MPAAADGMAASETVKFTGWPWHVSSERPSHMHLDAAAFASLGAQAGMNRAYGSFNLYDLYAYALIYMTHAYVYI